MHGLSARTGESKDALTELKDASILIVDDQEEHLILLSHALRKAGCQNVFTVSDPFLAPEIHHQLRPDLVLLDYRLPPVDGFQVLDQLWESHSSEDHSPVIMITAGAPESVRLKALELGVSDFLERPQDILELIFRVRNVLRIHRLYRQVHQQMMNLDDLVRLRTSELERARKDVLDRLALAAEFRDDQTGDHARRVGEISRLIAVELGMDPEYCEGIASAALLHDLGKIGMPDSVLLKPCSLTKEEFETIRAHPVIGAKILMGCNEPILSMAREIALTHHERWDGRGYPSQLAGHEIPLSGRIVSVADAYDAMTSERPYKHAMSKEAAIREIFRGRRSQFDPKVVSAFFRAVRHKSS